MFRKEVKIQHSYICNKVEIPIATELYWQEDWNLLKVEVKENCSFSTELH